MPVDGGMSNESDRVDAEPEDEGLRDAILVTDADNPTAEQVILQLILSRCTKLCLSLLLHDLVWAPAQTFPTWYVHVLYVVLYTSGPSDPE